MKYEIRNNKIYTRGIEYSLAYHCNLRCASCSHLSPFLKSKFPSIESFQKDISILCTVLHSNELRLLGGEPLLNPKINDFIKIAKEYQIADKIVVTTNGILLSKMNDLFWDQVDSVTITLYPGIKYSKERIDYFSSKAKESDTELILFSNPEFRTTIVTQPHPDDFITKLIFLTCENVHLLHCHMIHEGMFYKCAVPPFLSEYLSKLGIFDYNPLSDGINIHDSENLFEDLKSYLESEQALSSCQYCLGYLGKKQKNIQLNKDTIEKPQSQNITRNQYLDKKRVIIGLIKNCRHLMKYIKYL